MRGQGFRIFSRELKEVAVRRVLAGEKIRAVADDLGLRRQLLYTWRDYYAAPQRHLGAGLRIALADSVVSSAPR